MDSLFFRRDQEHEVACPGCTETVLQMGEDEEMEVKDEYRGKPTSRPYRRAEPRAQQRSNRRSVGETLSSVGKSLSKKSLNGSSRILGFCTYFTPNILVNSIPYFFAILKLRVAFPHQDTSDLCM